MNLKLTIHCYLFILIIFAVTGCETGLDPTPDPLKLQDKTEFTTAGEKVDGQYIVTLKSDHPDLLSDTISESVKKTLNQIESISINYGIERSSILNEYTHSLRGFTAKLNEMQLRYLENDDKVAFIEQDRTIGLVPPIGNLLDDIIDGNIDQSTPYGINRVGGPFNGTGMSAWVIDTGVDMNHNDLLVDNERSRSFVITEPTPDDLHGHGTHVAGTIAALDNDIDVVGVAAGANIVAVKVLGATGIGLTSWVMDGIDYVAGHANAGDVVNMSLGGSSSEALDEAVKAAADKGIFFAIAAGNDSEHAENYSPARVVHDNTWTVSAVDQNDVFASFSNYGNPPVRYAAPGVNIHSLWINNGTNTISGTSMAAPHVAGILLVSNGNPGSDGTAIDDPTETPDPIVFYTEMSVSTE